MTPGTIVQRSASCPRFPTSAPLFAARGLERTSRGVNASRNALMVNALLTMRGLPERLQSSRAVVTETSSRHIRFRGRSFPILALEPESPLAEWIERLDAHLARAPAFFRDKSIVVDVAGLGIERPGVVGLVKDLSERGISVMGLTGVEMSWGAADLPPILTGGRAVPRVDE